MSNEVTLTDIANKFICENCQDYLRPPISVCTGGALICGSCSSLSECQVEILGTCQLLENIGHLLIFPCRYNEFGCKKCVSWDNIDDHETECSFKQFKCPLCGELNQSWKGTLSNLNIHILHFHKSLVAVTGSFTASLNDSKELLFFVNGENLYVLIYECDISKNLLWISVKWIGVRQQPNRQYFKLTLCFPNSDNHCEKKQLDLIDSFDIDKKSAIKIDLRVLKMKLQRTWQNFVEVKVDIFLRMPLHKINSHEDILEDVECIVCHDFMTAPIFQCVIGHSFCAVCKTKLMTCPVCREPFGNMRNFALESISSKINFKCFHADEGCLFVSSLGNVISHEAECNFSLLECPLKHFVAKCNWRGKLHQIIAHTSKVHGVKFFV